jgi:hypothetical protein
MSAPRICAALLAVVTLAVGCSDDKPAPTTATASSASAGTSTTTTTTTTTSTTPPAAAQQPAIWPAVGVVFTSPRDAAQDFVTKVLGAGVLGEFRQGDSRSGEIEVLSAPEGGGTPVVRSRLLLRQLGPRDGWFILAAVSDNATITVPEPGTLVAAGALTVSGRARGFEANVVVRAFPAGDANAPFDQAITQGGALATPEPYTVTLDLSGAESGQIVTILVRGGTGLETDPGEFSAIPVVITP